jgi:hypothetical protein
VKKIQFDLNDEGLITVAVKEKEGHLSAEIFCKLCHDLDPLKSDKITKPRIGDIFKIIGEPQDPITHHGIQIK